MDKFEFASPAWIAGPDRIAGPALPGNRTAAPLPLGSVRNISAQRDRS